MHYGSETVAKIIIVFLPWHQTILTDYVKFVYLVNSEIEERSQVYPVIFQFQKSIQFQLPFTYN